MIVFPVEELYVHVYDVYVCVCICIWPGDDTIPNMIHSLLFIRIIWEFSYYKYTAVRLCHNLFY